MSAGERKYRRCACCRHEAAEHRAISAEPRHRWCPQCYRVCTGATESHLDTPGEASAPESGEAKPARRRKRKAAET